MSIKFLSAIKFCALLVLTSFSMATLSTAAEEVGAPRVFIISPENGATVTSPVEVVFGIENFTLAKAGDNPPNSGHHHLLIDLEELPELDKPLPANDNVKHFGGAQTSTTVELSAGTHTLQLLLGDYQHIPHAAPLVSEKITIEVTE